MRCGSSSRAHNGDAQVVVKNGAFSIYDPMSNVVYKGTLPTADAATRKRQGRHRAGALGRPDPVPAQPAVAAPQRRRPDPRNVAGQPAYKVVLSPKHSGGLIGDVQLAWDATHGVPLGIAIYSRNSSSPVLELKATDISLRPVATKEFNVTPPAGAKVVRIATPADTPPPRPAQRRGKALHASTAHADVTGGAAVQAHLPFKLAAPNKLVGLPRQSAQLLDWGGSPAALVTYGQGLGGIAVIEQTAPGAAEPAAEPAGPEAASACRPCRSTAPPGRSSTPRSGPSCASRAAASSTR